MTMDTLKLQEGTNISNYTFIQKEPSADVETTLEMVEENAEKDANSSLNNEKQASENAENDPNLTNKNSISHDNKVDIVNGLKENIDSTTNPKLSADIESDNETEDLVNNLTSQRKSKKLTLFNSDSENEDETRNEITTTEQNSGDETIEPERTHHKKLKRIAIIDSDSEDETEVNPKPDSANNDVLEYKSVDQNDMKEEKTKKNLYSLCDSESSDENNEEHENNEDKHEGGISETELEALQSNEVISKSRKGKQKNENKEEKMTVKKALEQRKEILAESQRRVRESRVSLPYHKPKCRSLKEFLQNRPKLAAPLRAVAQGNSPSLPIKMSMEQLKVFTQKIKEREKEVEKFYESESESEPEEETTSDKTESTDANEASTSGDKEVESIEDSSKTELENTENNLVETIESVDIDKNIDENNEATELIVNENSGKNAENDKIEEKCETSEIENKTITLTSEETNTEEVEQTITSENTELDKGIEISEIETMAITTTSEVTNTEEIEQSSIASENTQSNTRREMSEIENKAITTSSEVINTKEIEQGSVIFENTRREISEIENMAINTTSEVTTTEEIEQTSTTSEKTTQSNKSSSDDVENDANLVNSNQELKLATKEAESEEQVYIENYANTEMERNKKIVLLSDILVKPTEPIEAKNIYNLDDEILELASEVAKEEEEQDDSYEFNLDGIEDEDDEEQEKREKLKRKKITTEEFRRRKMEILERVSIVTPRLSVGPNEVLDLEKGIAMPDEITQLKEKFLRHNMKLEKHSQKNEISIMSVSDGQIHKETVAFKMDDDGEDTKPLEKPGVRMQKLREELQHRMSLRRSDLWKEKLTKKSENGGENDDGDDENDGEKSECDAKDILDNEEEEDFTDTEEDEELEENDCDMSDKKKKKSAYLDEEAEESETEEIEIDENEEEALLNENEEDEDDAIEEDEDAMNEEDEEADVEDNEETAEVEEAPKKKVLKRIIKAFEDDSDDEDETSKVNHMYETICKSTKIDKDCASENVMSSLEIPNFKIREPMMSPQKSEDHFATPVTYMTGLKNLNTSGSRFIPPESLLNEESTQKSQVLGHDGINTAQKWETNTQHVDENNECTDALSTQDVLAICSAEFPSSSKCVSSPEISTQQLREVFTGSMKSSSTDFNTQDIDDICSGGFTGVSQVCRTQEKEVALDDKDEHLISQLIDEDELENFKKKFESPGINSNMNITKTNTVEEVEEVVGTGGIIDSDDEETGLKLKNRKRKRLAFSDDEESSTSETAQEETIDLHDDDLADNVEYDSEENEIEGTGDKELNEGNEKKKFKISDFFEDEAELSESEWGSADEDERNMDDLEFEKGDEEKFDDDQMRTDIEKLQMKQMLDEDNRELKMLQELLLEDGELHGSGRQRQFRWKNIDAAGNENEEKKDEDDDVYLEEDESEEKWRKERHEREMLKLKKQSQDEDDSLIIESQNLTFTHKSLKIKSQTTFSPQVTTSSEVDSSPKKIKQPFTLLNKRGSFLSRGEKILQKIAETSKVSFTNKNVNRIVFQTIDEDTKKRKASSANLGNSTPVALKKLRLSGLSPGLNKNKPKLGKSLFEKILE